MTQTHHDRHTDAAATSFTAGDRVRWYNPPLCMGTVIKNNGGRCKVQWDTGEVRRDDPDNLRLIEPVLNPDMDAAATQGGATYPVIFNGDHAEFEAEWAGKDPKSRPDWPLPSFDAQDWAQAFCEIAGKHGIKDGNGKPLDEGWMISWFANALMRGFDEARARIARATDPSATDAGRAQDGEGA